MIPESLKKNSFEMQNNNNNNNKFLFFKKSQKAQSQSLSSPLRLFKSLGKKLFENVFGFQVIPLARECRHVTGGELRL